VDRSWPRPRKITAPERLPGLASLAVPCSAAAGLAWWLLSGSGTATVGPAQRRSVRLSRPARKGHGMGSSAPTSADGLPKLQHKVKELEPGNRRRGAASSKALSPRAEGSAKSGSGRNRRFAYPASLPMRHAPFPPGSPPGSSAPRNRAMLGPLLGDGDFDKPIIGIANGKATITPATSASTPLTERAVLRAEAGAMPQTFLAPITSATAVSMGYRGDENIRLVVRARLIADFDRTACNVPEQWTGCWRSGGCDKELPAAMLRHGPAWTSRRILSTRTIKARQARSCDLTVVSAFEAVGQFSGGRIDEAELLAIEKNACPVPAAAAACSPPTTDESAFRGMGRACRQLHPLAAEDPEKAESARPPSAEVLVGRHRREHPPQAT